MSNTRSVAQSGVSSVASIYMRQVYQWMTMGLGVTTLMAWFVASTPAVQQVIFGNSLIMIGLIVAQFGLVIALSAAVHKMSSSTATGLFLLYSALTGATLSSIFVIYPIASITNAFLVTTGTFLAMTVYGTVTKRDLTAMGSFLIMGVIGLFLASIVNIFMQSGTLYLIISGLGVLIFSGLIAYDTQRLKMTYYAVGGDKEALAVATSYGALTLFINFVNLFQFLLAFMGGNRN